MAGNKSAPVDVYVVFSSGTYSLNNMNASPSLQGVYVSQEAAMIAANGSGLVQPMPLNYSGAYVFRFAVEASTLTDSLPVTPLPT
jgi:hypothetical protein